MELSKRIVAAWKVLRGEWTAGPPRPQWVMTTQNTYNSAGSYTLTFDHTAAFNPRKAGRRAVRKHANALRRLAR